MTPDGPRRGPVPRFKGSSKVKSLETHDVNMEAFRVEIKKIVDARGLQYRSFKDPNGVDANKLLEAKALLGDVAAGSFPIDSFIKIVNVEDLTPADARMWNLLKPDNYHAGELSRAYFQAYEKEVDASLKPSRIIFKEIMRSKVGGLFGIEEVIDSLSNETNEEIIKKDLIYLIGQTEYYKKGSPFQKLIEDTVNNYLPRLTSKVEE